VRRRRTGAWDACRQGEHRARARLNRCFVVSSGSVATERAHPQVHRIWPKPRTQDRKPP
jgi:hypothetical protein